MVQLPGKGVARVKLLSSEQEWVWFGIGKLEWGAGFWRVWAFEGETCGVDGGGRSSKMMMLGHTSQMKLSLWPHGRARVCVRAKCQWQSDFVLSSSHDSSELGSYTRIRCEVKSLDLVKALRYRASAVSSSRASTAGIVMLHMLPASLVTLHELSAVQRHAGKCGSHPDQASI